MSAIAIVFDSGTGRTKQVAEQIARGAETLEEVETQLFSVEELLKADEAMDELDRFDTILFGSPTYMGTVTADFKRFMDASSGKWMNQAWKDKLTSGFTNSTGLNGDKANLIATLQIFAGQHSMIWISQGTPIGALSEEGHELNRLSSWSGLMTQSESRAQSPHPADLATAFEFGKRVASLTRRWTGDNPAMPSTS